MEEKKKLNGDEARRARTVQSKKDFLKAFKQSLGIIAPAAKAANVGRRTVYDWLRDDPEFKKVFEEVKEDQKDFVESALLKKVKNEDTTAIIFYSKTQMKDRGYIEKTEIQLDEKPIIRIGHKDKE
jgi:hypothetical protein